VTPEELAATLDRFKGPFSSPRKLIAGHMAWEIIKGLLDPERIADGTAGIPITMCFGMQVHIDPEMPACAWRIVEDAGPGVERTVAEHDWAPGFRHAVRNPADGRIYVFNIPEPDTGAWRRMWSW
jgi:hypothetical protein